MNHPELLTLTTALSRHAKREELAFADRAALYGLKRQAIQVLCARGELMVSSTSAAPWTFGEEFEDAFPKLRHLTRAAAAEDRALTGAELRRAGLTSADLPLSPRGTGTFKALSDSQRWQLHPKGGWLVGFAPAGEGRAWLHLPFLLVDWLTPPPATKARQVLGGYGRPPDETHCVEGDLRALIGELGLTPQDFPQQLRVRRRSWDARLVLIPELS